MADEPSASDYADNVVTHPSGFRKGPSGQPPLQPPGGGGTCDGMEARIASLETHLEYVRRDVGEIKADLAALKKDASETRLGVATLGERVAHLPGKGFIVGAVIASLTIIGGFVTIVPKFQAALGIAPAVSQRTP